MHLHHLLTGLELFNSSVVVPGLLEYAAFGMPSKHQQFDLGDECIPQLAEDGGVFLQLLGLLDLSFDLGCNLASKTVRVLHLSKSFRVVAQIAIGVGHV